MNTDFQSKDFQFEPGNHKEKDVIWIKFRKEETLIKKVKAWLVRNGAQRRGVGMYRISLLLGNYFLLHLK